jgi:flagellar motor protein MotB
MSGYKRKQVKKEDGLWLLSFTDLCLTLLAFFVLMVSTMEPRKKNVLNAMADKEQKPITIDERELQLNKVAGEVIKMIEKENILDQAQVTKLPQGIYIEFKDNVFFSAGSSEIELEKLPLAKHVLGAIAKVGKDFQMVIEGHTDDQSFGQGENLNWNLSSSRAIKLLRRFVTLGVPESNISVVAYAHTRPRVEYKMLQGDPLEKARSQNRRVAVWLKLPVEGGLSRDSKPKHG